MSVNALNGLLLFLPKPLRLREIRLKGVNALNGLLLFLRKQHRLTADVKLLCQRPQRASLISTVPSHTPHKYWLFRLIFAGICLNILKSSFFDYFLACS